MLGTTGAEVKIAYYGDLLDKLNEAFGAAAVEPKAKMLLAIFDADAYSYECAEIAIRDVYHGNAGCDCCGTDDRAAGSRFCRACIDEEGHED